MITKRYQLLTGNVSVTPRVATRQSAHPPAFVIANDQLAAGNRLRRLLPLGRNFAGRTSIVHFVRGHTIEPLVRPMLSKPRSVRGQFMSQRPVAEWNSDAPQPCYLSRHSTLFCASARHLSGALARSKRCCWAGPRSWRPVWILVSGSGAAIGPIWASSGHSLWPVRAGWLSWRSTRSARKSGTTLCGSPPSGIVVRLSWRQRFQWV